jgi:hypothetical protein
MKRVKYINTRTLIEKIKGYPVPFKLSLTFSKEEIMFQN